MPLKLKAPIAVALGVLALIVLGVAKVVGWDLGEFIDATLKMLVGTVVGYLIPGPSEQRRVVGQ